MGESVIEIGHGDDARLDRNAFLGISIGIPFAIPPLMMAPSDPLSRLKDSRSTQGASPERAGLSLF